MVLPQCPPVKNRAWAVLGLKVLVVPKSHTARTSPFGATAMFAAAVADDKVTGLPHTPPDCTDACRPPESGVKMTADVPLPLVETAWPLPLATSCGELQVWAIAMPDRAKAQATTSNVATWERVRKSCIIDPLRQWHAILPL